MNYLCYELGQNNEFEAYMEDIKILWIRRIFLKTISFSSFAHKSLSEYLSSAPSK